MKRSWKKKASVWTMAAAMTVSYIPQYSFAEENTEIIKQETQTQTIEEQTMFLTYCHLTIFLFKSTIIDLNSGFFRLMHK